MFNRAFDAALGATTSSRTRLAVAGTIDDDSAIEQDYLDFIARATGRLGDPVFDDRADRAAIDTWFPEARRLAAWTRDGGLFFIAVERAGPVRPSELVVGYATDEEITMRRTYSGHTRPVQKPARVSAPLRSSGQGERLSRPMPPDGWLPDRHYYHLAQGLQPLSRRERTLRVVVAILILLVAGVAVLVLAGPR